MNCIKTRADENNIQIRPRFIQISVSQRLPLRLYGCNLSLCRGLSAWHPRIAARGLIVLQIMKIEPPREQIAANPSTCGCLGVGE